MAPEPPLPTEPSPVAYLAALAAYVVLGLLFRSAVLNWIVGPLFLVAALHVLPAGLRRLRSTGGGDPLPPRR
jgi:hypothetical protein